MKGIGFQSIGATTFLGPIPAVLVGCAADDGWQHGGDSRPNLITVAWTGVCCSNPPMLSVAIRPERYSHALIKSTGEFTVNLVGAPLCRAMDYCGVKSGREMDKFAALGLTPVTAGPLSVAPAVLQAPACLCCKVTQILPLGSHDLFLAEIVDMLIDQKYLLADGSVDEQAMELVAFVHGKYFTQGQLTGFFGYSVAGEEALKRRLGSPKEVGGGTRKPAVKAKRPSGGARRKARS
ncbi:MAG: flavin reductase family protein [Eubacteriales bacterium]|nr:flavin reductase family protein [Eubacteriales bacterium]